MEYSSHTYPRELAERIISEWSEVTNPLDGLPPKEALVSLLSEAFQASLLREESRPIKCRLVLINPCELREAEGPPTGMQVLQLQDERKLRAQEIRRLSPCATFYRSLIAVRWDSEKGFWIWAILNSGTRWVARIDGGRLQSSAAPNRLIINISGPGNLIISRGDKVISTLLYGKLEDHGFDIYEAGWLQKSQEAFAHWAIGESFKDHDIGAIVRSDFVKMLGQNFTRRIISQVRRAQHGGMLVIVRTEDTTKIVDPIGSIRPKYWIKGTRASRRSRELLFAVMRTLSQVGAEHGLKTVGWKDYQELEDERLARLDESIFECAHFLADLMAVDGALVLTAAWDVIGFGAEIYGPSNRNEVVYRALDLEATELIEERADEAGTRHRAAYRLSREHPECMIIVVSQDGAVRYVGNPNRKVTYWELGSFKP
ncbi:MAG: DNA integrity scanning protein DisA nucleotide-binding domain protein [Verrucomicrobia bacterium]|nr:DNA integrity scanning protein DisA nucleotide-binding domain protein [Verrucomicrobiota bacterium]